MIVVSKIASEFLEFFINLALYLKAHKFDVVFKSQDKYNESIIKKYGFKIVRRFEKGDTVLFWNENKQSEVCKILNLKMWFFENGLFDNTLQCDSKGVNYNISFSNLSYRDFLKYRYKETLLPEIEFKPIKIKHSLIKRLFLRINNKDYGFLYSIKYNFARKKRLKKGGALPENYVFWPLQVSSDTQIQVHSDFDSMYQALEYILTKVWTASNIVLKEHPAERENIDYSVFENNRIKIINSDLSDLIDKSQYVITINSSVGLQALEHGKKVVVLGSAMYRNIPQKEYTDHFRELFISGNWRQPTSVFLRKIAERIV